MQFNTQEVVYEGRRNQKQFQFMDDNNVRVFKYHGEHSPNAENSDNLVDYVLHEYLLHLSSRKVYDLHKSEVFIGN